MREKSRWLLAAALLLWVAVAVVRWVGAGPLGYDEAQYALGGHDWLAGGEARYFYVAPGMAWVAVPGIALGGGELALRLLPLLVGVGFVIAVARLARGYAGEPVAAWTACALVVTQPLVERATDLLSDIPAAACLVGALALVAGELLRDEGPRWRLVVVAPLLAAAFYLRYGSVVPIAVVVASGLALGHRAVRTRPAPVIVAAVVFAALLAPHFLVANRLYGSPLAILREAATVPQSGGSIVKLLAANPFVRFGAAAPILALGLASIVRPRGRYGVLLWLVAVGDLVGISLTDAPARARYVFFAIALLAVLGVDVALRLAARLPERARRGLAVVAVVGLAASAAWSARNAARTADHARAAYRAPLVAAEAIRRDVRGQPCQVVGVHAPQVAWYSRCFGYGFFLDEALARGEPIYAVGPTDLAGVPGRPYVLLTLPFVDVVRFGRP